MKTVLTIAGSDCSGGAGIQADIKTMIMNGVYAMSAITALTAQNTTGVYGIQETSSEFLDNQLDCIFTDIFPDAVKIGMLSSSEIMRHVASKLRQYQARHIVLDPVMVLMMPTIFFMRTDIVPGYMVNASIIQTLTVPAAHFQAQLPRTSPEVFLSKLLCVVPNSISLML